MALRPELVLGIFFFYFIWFRIIEIIFLLKQILMTHLINIPISCKLSSVSCFSFLWTLPSAMFELCCFGRRNCSEQKRGPNYGLTSLCPSSHKAKGPWIPSVLEALRLLQSYILLNFLPLSSYAQHSTHHTSCLLSHHGGVDLESPPKASGMKARMWTLAWYCSKEVKPFNRWDLVRCSRLPKAYVLEEVSYLPSWATGGTKQWGLMVMDRKLSTGSSN